MNIANLIRKGRVERITKTDDQGKTWLIGFRRRAGSRKAGQSWDMKKPVLLDAQGRVVPEDPASVPYVGEKEGAVA